MDLLPLIPSDLWGSMKRAGLKGFLLASPFDAFFGNDKQSFSNQPIYQIDNQMTQEFMIEGELTPELLYEELAPFLKSLSDLQHVIDELLDRPPFPVTIQQLNFIKEESMPLVPPRSEIPSDLSANVETSNIEVTKLKR